MRWFLPRLPQLKEALPELEVCVSTHWCGRLRSPADLAQVTLLHASPHKGEWAAWMRGAGVQRHEAQRDQVFDTLDMSLQAAERGQGVAIADPAMLGEALQSGRLAMPFDARVPSGNSYFITYPPQRQGQRKIALFEAWLLAQMAPPSA